MRYFLGFFVAMMLIILLIILIFRGGGKPKVPLTAKTLDSYASTNAEVSLTIDGPINANQDHEQVRITVDRDNATFEHLHGYDGDVTSQQRYPNTPSAYSAFLFALAHAGFTRGSTDPALRDERGYCPTGDRYVFVLRQDNKDIERYWATNCGKPKTYLGALSLTTNLFTTQISDYDNLVKDIKL